MSNIECRTYQKVTNLNVDIPHSSWQHSSIIKAWIKDKLWRHVVLCSNLADCCHLVFLSRCRLLAPGHRVSFIENIIALVDHGRSTAALDKARFHHHDRKTNAFSYETNLGSPWPWAMIFYLLAYLLDQFIWSNAWMIPRNEKRFILCWCHGNSLGSFFTTSQVAGLTPSLLNSLSYVCCLSS